MPENYVFTITFDSTKSLKKKLKLIEDIPTMFQGWINQEADLFYTIEYHKRSDHKSNNYFRPHIHGILTTEKHLAQYKIQVLTSDIKQRYGKILQFALQEDLEEVDGWRLYCLKDVEENERVKQFPHKFYHKLTKTIL